MQVWGGIRRRIHALGGSFIFNSGHNVKKNKSFVLEIKNMIYTYSHWIVPYKVGFSMQKSSCLPLHDKFNITHWEKYI